MPRDPLSTWIGLFRAVNVGGRGRLRMRELVQLLTGLGFTDVRSYLQSGNVVFRGRGPPVALAKDISAAVERRFGFRPQLLLLGGAQLRRAAAGNPFATARPQALHLWFLEQRPRPGAARLLETVRAPRERIALRGQVLYLYAPDGIGRSKLAASLERLLAVAATARNWRTVTSLLSLAGGS